MAFGGLKCMKKGQELKTIIAIIIRGEVEVKLGSQELNLYFLRGSSSLPPKKLLFESTPIPLCFLCKYEAMATFIVKTSLRKPYLLCLCCEVQTATYTRKEKVALAAKLSNKKWQ